MKNFSREAVVAVAILLVGVGVVAIVNYQGRQSSKEITDFKSCVAAGNAVMESYPERCLTKDGRSFTNDGQSLPK